jgi:glycosyltransferase involved in cell wall biosynthesis
MHVLHVTHQYPPAIGGSEKYIADLSEELVRRGHQVDVYTSRSLDYQSWKNELGPGEVRNGVNVFRFRSLRRGSLQWWMLHAGLRRYWSTRARRYEPLIFLGGGPICPGMLWRMWKVGRRYDLVHLNCLVYGTVAYGYAMARARGLPVVVTPHAHPEQEATYGIGYQRSVLRGSDHVLADTPAERAFLIDLGVDGSRVTTAGVGLQPEDYPCQDRESARQQLGLPPDAAVLLFLGRKAEYKGFDVALEVYKALKPACPRLWLVTVGPGTEFSMALVARNPDLPGFLDLGPVAEETKLAALNACDCLLLPSGGEAFGIVLLEAWLMGKPVIAARTPAVSAVIDDGQDGFLTAPGSTESVARGVSRLLEEPDLAREMGARGRAKVLSRYTVTQITDIVEGTYMRVLRRRWRERQQRTA